MYSDYPEVFHTGILPEKKDMTEEQYKKHCCALGLMGWGFTMMKKPFPVNFGLGMVILAKELGISGIPDSFVEYSKTHFNV